MITAETDVSTLGPFYAVAALVGFIYAGTMPLYAVIIRENFPLRMMGTIIGGTAMAGSLGMSTGPLLGGLIYDHFDSYTLMYVGSWGMGLAAMMMLMAFRPCPRRQTEMAVPAAYAGRTISASRPRSLGAKAPRRRRNARPFGLSATTPSVSVIASDPARCQC